jgi:1-phosphofructokinase
VIVTLTANPSLDRTLEIPALERGQVLRATAARVHPGGKGVNVARALVANGVPARAVLPTGGHEGDHLLDLLAGLGIEVVPIPIAEPVRENVTVVEPDGAVTKLNAPGPRLSWREAARLVEVTVQASVGADWVALCGALPPGAPEDLYARLVTELRVAGVRVAVDTSGAELRRAIDARPDLIKPNARELAEAVDRPIETLRDVVEAGRRLLVRGVDHVVVSLGREGAVSVADGLALRAWTEAVPPRSTVGAGDATLAGFLATDGERGEALRAAVAWGASAVRLPGTEMPSSDDIDLERVMLEELDATRASDERRSME